MNVYISCPKRNRYGTIDNTNGTVALRKHSSDIEEDGEHSMIVRKAGSCKLYYKGVEIQAP